MGNPSPIPDPIIPDKHYIVSGTEWLGAPSFPGECGVGAHNVIWEAFHGWELSAALEGFEQCVVGKGLPGSGPWSATSIAAIFGPYD